MYHVIDFIKSNENWRTLLSEAPYALTIKERDVYCLLMYKQTESKFSEQFVKESRGLIFRTDTFEVVCAPFEKFFTYDEFLAAKLDESSAIYREKRDGSIIKVWFDDGKWHFSTQGEIDAKNAYIAYEKQTDSIKTFYDLITRCLPVDFFEEADPEYTYMFELTSPYNKVIIPYDTIELRHIGTRHTKSGQEFDMALSTIPKPKTYHFDTISEAVEYAKTLPLNCEGFVAFDKDFNRVKIKSPLYLAQVHLIDDGIINRDRALEIVIKGEASEVGALFPEAKQLLMTMEEDYEKLKVFLSQMHHYVEKTREIDGKTFAKNVSNCPGKSIAFLLRSGKITDPLMFFKELKPKKRLSVFDEIKKQKFKNCFL